MKWFKILLVIMAFIAAGLSCVQAAGTIDQPGGLCLSCHNGSLALGSSRMNKTDPFLQ